MVVVATGLSTTAWAAKRVAVTASSGGKSAEIFVRTQLWRVLKAHKITAIAGKGGVPTDDAAWVALGQKLKVDGFIDLKFDLGRAKQSVEVSVITAADGSAVGSETFTTKGPPGNLGAAVAGGFWKKLGAHVLQVKAAKAAKAGEGSGMPPRDLSHEPQAVPAPERAARSTSEKEHGPKEKPAVVEPAEEAVAAAETPELAGQPKSTASVVAARPAPANEKREGANALAIQEPAVAVVLAVAYLHRSFSYTPNAAAPANSSSNPTVGGDLIWFPAARVGFQLGGEYASWLKVLGRYPSVISELRASIAVRLPLSFGYAYAHAGGFRQSFTIADDGTGMRQYLALPDAVYLGARAGAGIHARFGRGFWLDGEASYRMVTDMAGGSYGITSPGYFAKAASGPAFDGTISVSYRLTRSLALQAGGDFRRYMITAHGMSGDRIVASDAIDQYLAGWVGVVGLFGGR